MTADKRRFSGNGERVATEEKEVKWRIKPRYKWVLIRQVAIEEVVTEGGVIRPASDFFMMEGAKSSRGLVVEAAEGTGLEPGTMVIFTDFPITLKDLEFFTGDSELKLVRDEEVYAVVERCT